MAIVINGSGTVTGISVGGLPDGIVDAGTLASDALDSAVTINDTGADVDFGVESDTKTHALFVEGLDGSVGIGAAPTAPNSDFCTLEIKNIATDGRALLALTANSSEYSHIYFGNEGDQDIGGIQYYHPNNNMYFKTNTATQLQITDDGRGLSLFTAKAWIRWRNNTSVAIRASHNVSSITDNGTGDTSINFTNNLADADYAISVSGITQYSFAGMNYNVTGTSTSTYQAQYHENNIARDGEFRSIVFGN